MRVDPILTTLVLEQMAGIDWTSSKCPAAFAAYNISTGAERGYAAKCFAPVERQNNDKGLLLQMNPPALHVHWLSNVTRSTDPKF